MNRIFYLGVLVFLSVCFSLPVFGQSGGEFLAGVHAVKLESSGADYAEYLPHLNPSETIKAGDVVGVFGGKITLKTAGADRVMIVSTMPIVLGNWKPSDNVTSSPVAFVGQVPVRVLGSVNSGDYILANSVGNGFAVAKSAADMTVSDIPKVLGQAWGNSPGKGVQSITVALLPGGVANALLSALSKENASLRTKLDELDARMRRMQEVLDAIKR